MYLGIKYRHFPISSSVSDVFISFFRFYNEKKIVTEEIADVADFMVSLLGTDCSGEDELTYLTLRVFLFPSFLMQAIIIILILHYIVLYDITLYYHIYYSTSLGGEEVFIIFLCFHHCQAIGNMGAVMEKAKPSVKASLKTCIRNEAASLPVQKAAIQAFRKMTITEEVNWSKEPG